MRAIVVILLATAILPGAAGSATTTASQAPKKLLFLTHAALYKHTSLGPAEKAVTELGKTGGFEVTTVEGYKQDPKLLGGYFNRNLPQGTIAVLKVEDTKHPATKMLGASWPLVDEFYLFGTAPWDAARPDENIDVLFKNKIPMGFSRDKVHVLMSLDTAQMDMSKQPHLKHGGDYPQAWTKDVGKGRTFYTSLGHRDDIWSNDPVFRAHINGGIRWALGLE